MTDTELKSQILGMSVTDKREIINALEQSLQPTPEELEVIIAAAQLAEFESKRAFIFAKLMNIKLFRDNLATAGYSHPIEILKEDFSVLYTVIVTSLQSLFILHLGSVEKFNSEIKGPVDTAIAGSATLDGKIFIAVEKLYSLVREFSIGAIEEPD